MSDSPTAPIATRLPRLLGTAVALALVSATMWFAWLGWDHEYQLVDGVEQGPYEAWQVIGCALSIAVAAVLAHQVARGVGAIFVLSAAASIGFAVPWTVDAAGSDDTGLYAVGLVFLLIGSGFGLTVLLTVSHVIAVLRSRARAEA